MRCILFILIIPSILHASCPPWERYIIAFCEKGSCKQGFIIEDGGAQTNLGCVGQPGEFRASSLSKEFVAFSPALIAAKEIEGINGVFLFSSNEDKSSASNLGVLWFGSCYHAHRFKPGEIDASCEKAKRTAKFKKLADSVGELNSLKELYLNHSLAKWEIRQRKLRELMSEVEVNGG